MYGVQCAATPLMAPALMVFGCPNSLFTQTLMIVSQAPARMVAAVPMVSTRTPVLVCRDTLAQTAKQVPGCAAEGVCVQGKILFC